MRALLLIFGALLGLIVWGAAALWPQLDWRMSIHGWIALSMGVILTIGLGAGLMALSFFSARRGYDDNAARDHGDEDPRPGGENR